MNGTLLDCPQLAERLNVPLRLVRRLVFEKRIPYVKVGRYVRFDVDEVNAWLASHQVPQLNFLASNDVPDLVGRNADSVWR